VGNRPGGERLSWLVSFEALKLAAGMVLLSPSIPLLFMGEEYGEIAPFEYFVSHSDPGLIEAVRGGRREEVAAFGWQGAPSDPQDESTFLRAKLNRELQYGGDHQILLEFYRELIRLRKEYPALSTLKKEHLEVEGIDAERVLILRRWSETDEAVVVYHLGGDGRTFLLPLPAGRWEKALDSADERWQGPGERMIGELTSQGKVSLPLAPWSFVLFHKDKERVD
jgi:maltooligosyltrehalose trehalohydrolase